jgi:hypothetical protein
MGEKEFWKEIDKDPLALAKDLYGCSDEANMRSVMHVTEPWNPEDD